MNLLPAIKAIKAQIADLERKHRQELEPYRESLDILRHINTACENCGGSGKVVCRTCAEDEGSERVCGMCGGTGISKEALA